MVVKTVQKLQGCGWGEGVVVGGGGGRVGVNHFHQQSSLIFSLPKFSLFKIFIMAAVRQSNSTAEQIDVM